jgi:glutamine amidotransferase
MTVVIVRYNAGNILSVKYALRRLGVDPVISDDPEILRKADHVIFPGVGEAGSAMEYLERNGLVEVLRELSQPFLGICLGLQLMCHHTEENDTNGLNIFNCTVRKFPPAEKVPHMGWNSLENLQGPLFNGITENSYVYYVHSYYADICEHSSALCKYILPFSAALQKDNYFAVQFHPEKSGPVGEKILRNFLRL